MCTYTFAFNFLRFWVLCSNRKLCIKNSFYPLITCHYYGISQWFHGYTYIYAYMHVCIHLSIYTWICISIECKVPTPSHMKCTQCLSAHYWETQIFHVVLKKTTDIRICSIQFQLCIFSSISIERILAGKYFYGTTLIQGLSDHLFFYRFSFLLSWVSSGV